MKNCLEHGTTIQINGQEGDHLTGRSIKRKRKLAKFGHYNLSSLKVAYLHYDIFKL